MVEEKIFLSIVIPTYGREEVLIDTLEPLLTLIETATEIVLVDQTEYHKENVQKQLECWHTEGSVRWIRQGEPSIPKAMNRGALEASGEILLYLDDDIIPDYRLLQTHIEEHNAHHGDIIAGRVLQPWHEDDHASEPFTQLASENKDQFMGGNFSIRRELLFSLGGFDENFKGAAYRFERDFADRLLDEGGTIWYEPGALIRHLHHSSGGTRSKGDHLTSWNPRHPVGAYYYLFTSCKVEGRVGQLVSRLFGSVATRHHLLRPWYIPITLFSEISGMFWAMWLAWHGPCLPLSASQNGLRL